MSTTETESVRAAVEALPASVRVVAVQWVDVHGSPKAKLVPREALVDVAVAGSGAGFAGFANDGFARRPEHPELLAEPDMATLTPLPHRPDTAVVLSRVMDDGSCSSCCPRSILTRVQEQAGERGMTPIVGMEPEFFLLRRDDNSEAVVPFDGEDVLTKPCYDLPALLRTSAPLIAMVEALTNLGLEISALDHEDANGQFEINFAHADALTTADRFTLVRSVVRDIAAVHGAIASFMPKPLPGRTGSGAHAHVSLAGAAGENLFLDECDGRGLGLSELAYRFIAGVLEHGRALAALKMPTVNSYRRLQAVTTRSGASWSPSAIVYGANNRTTMIRVPAPGRIEDRALDSSANPYLALAGLISAGLDGIDRELDPGEPVQGAATTLGAQTLPRTLAEALDALESDTVLRDGIGEQALAEFVAVKRDEWTRSMDGVSSWEHETYLTRP